MKIARILVVLTFGVVGVSPALAGSGQYSSKSGNCPSPCKGKGILTVSGGSDTNTGACNSDCGDMTGGVAAVE